MIVTTSREPTQLQMSRAVQIAEEYGGTVVAWQDFRQMSCGEYLVVQRDRVVYQFAGCSLRYHPGMAMVRLRRLQSGARDRMLAAMDLRPGDAVLDCTLGLGQDALVVSSHVGMTGAVFGLEGSRSVACVTSWGLKDYPFPVDFLSAAHRIEVCWDRWQSVLPAIPANSYDVVYFDPMFDSSIQQSSGMAGLRPFALLDDLDHWGVEQAVRVARRRVVIKARRGSACVRSLGFRLADRSRNSVQYGVIEVGEAV